MMEGDMQENLYLIINMKTNQEGLHQLLKKLSDLEMEK
jgi:hypothetical protein